MYQKNDIFEHFIKGMDRELQAQMRYWFTHQMMMDEIERKRELEQLKKEIIEEVLSRISITIDVVDAIKQIKELKDEIDKLGK